MSHKIKLPIAAALVLTIAAALMFAGSKVKIDFCKGVVKLDNGCAVLNETNGFASVIELDENGRITRRANLPIYDLFTLSVKNVHDMFTDDNGGVYVFCTVYGYNRTKKELIYKCDLDLGVMTRVCDLSSVSGYSAASGAIPYIDGGDIFIPMQKDDNSIDILKLSESGCSVAAEDCFAGGKDGTDRIFFRNGKVYFEDGAGEIFADGVKVYPPEGSGSVCTGLNYDAGFLNFIDTSDNSVIGYNIETGEIIKFDRQSAGANNLQHIMAYSNGCVTAAYEENESLRAYLFSDGAENIYSVVGGGCSWRSYALCVVVCAAATAALVLLYTILFVRLRRKKGGARRYQSIALRITAVSSAAGIVCGIAFGFIIQNMVKQLNVSLHDSVKTSSSRSFSSYILTNCMLEIKDGVPMLDDGSAEGFTRVVEGYQQALAENNGIECEFILLVRFDGKLYNLLSSPIETVPAEYIVSLRGLKMIEDGIASSVDRTFDDNMTSGMYKYSCSNFMMFDNNLKKYDAAVCTIIDSYRTRQVGFVLYLWLIAVVFGFVLLVIAASNIVLYCNLRGLKRLKKAFELYENGGEPSVFGLPGGDEIAETGQALMLMTEGTRVRTRDIGDGNRRYKRFMSAGILKLMGKSEISKVNFGDRVSVNALIMRFVIRGGSENAERVKRINEFIEMSGGILLNFGKGKADVCFTDKDRFVSAVEAAAELSSSLLMLVSFGKVEAGSAGSDNGAWLIGISEEFSEFERLAVIAGDEPRMLCTAKAAEKLNENKVSMRCDLRSILFGETEYFEIVLRESGGEDEHEETDNYHIGGANSSSLDPVL